MIGFMFWAIVLLIFIVIGISSWFQEKMIEIAQMLELKEKYVVI